MIGSVGLLHRHGELGRKDATRATHAAQNTMNTILSHNFLHTR